MNDIENQEPAESEIPNKSERRAPSSKEFFSGALSGISGAAKFLKDRLLGLKSEDLATENAEIDIIERNASTEIQEVETGIDAATLIKDEAQGYIENDDGVLAVVQKEGTEAKYITKNRMITTKGRPVEIYAHPTEPYQAKKAFLEKNGVGQAKNVLTILGANWPALYADLSQGKSNVVAIDQNPQQIDFLKALISDEHEFARMILNNKINFANRKEVPYYPSIKKSNKGTLANREVRYHFSGQDSRTKNYQQIRSLLADMTKNNRLSALNCDLEDLIRDGDLGNVSYADLSNVPELIGPQLTQQVLDKMPEGSSTYMSFIVKESEPFLNELEGWDLADSELNDGIRLVLLKKKASQELS